MLLNTRSWGEAKSRAIVCIHGVTQHSAIFEPLGQRLAEQGHFVIGVDLRGHGASDANPPWNTETHVRDIVETLEDAEVERALWVGHSYGGRIAAMLAAMEAERTDGVALLEVPEEVPAERALRAIETERLDWSFATIDGAIEAILSSDLVDSPPRDVVAAFVKSNVRQSATDGRIRFRFAPGAVIVAWNDMTLPGPPVAQTPTLLLNAGRPLMDTQRRDRHYREVLGDLHTQIEVPHGHNVLWEAPTETLDAVGAFVEKVFAEATS